MKKTYKKQYGFDEPRINDEIVGYDKVRLIYKSNTFEKSDKDFSEIVSLDEARNISNEYGLDLIEINKNINPPIIKLYDYKKYLFEQKKNNKEKSKSSNTLKEIQLSVNISEHDLGIKAKKAKEFIKNGDKVKVVLTMRGRENIRRDFSKECFNKFIEIMADVAVCESSPREDGNKVIVILKKKNK